MNKNAETLMGFFESLNLLGKKYYLTLLILLVRYHGIALLLFCSYLGLPIFRSPCIFSMAVLHIFVSFI